jgi:uncharacterized membrane protein
VTRLLAVAAAVLLGCLPATAAGAEVVEMSAEGIEYIDVAAVNNSGEVAGTASFGAGDPDTTRRGYRWQRGSGFTNLGVVGVCCGFNAASSASDINNQGLVSGRSTTNDQCFPGRGVVWTGGAPTTLIDAFGAKQDNATCPMVYSSEAKAINDAGVVAGTSPDQSCSRPYGRGRAFVAQSGSSTPMALPTSCSNTGGDLVRDINAAGDVLIFSSTSGAQFTGGLYSAATGAVTTLNLTPAGEHGLSDTGVVVGDETGKLTGVRYDNGTYTPLPPLPGFPYSHAAAVSNAGDVVGWSTDGPNYVATLWRGDTPIDLNTLLPAGAPFKLGTAVDISDDGRYIVGEIQGSGQKARAYRLEVPEPLSVSLVAGRPGNNDLFAVQMKVANGGAGPVSLRFPSGMGVVQADVPGRPRLGLSPYFAPAPPYPGSLPGKGASAHTLVFEVLSPGAATLLTRVIGKDADGNEQAADAALRVESELRPMTEFETHASVVGGLALLFDQVGNARDTAVAGLTDSVRKQIAKGGRKNRGLMRSSAFERAFALSLGMKENALSWLTRFQRLERARPEPGYGELAMIFAEDGAKAFGNQLQKRMGETGDKLVVGPALFWRDFALRGKDGGMPRILWELGDMTRAGAVKGGGYLGEAGKFYAHPLANSAELWREMPKLYEEYSEKIAKSIGETELKVIRWGDLANERPRQAMSQFSEALGRIEANILADAFDDLLQDKALDSMKKFTRAAKAVDEGGDLLGGQRMTRRLADPKGTFLARNGQVTNKPLPGLGNVTPAQADFLSTTTKRINDKFDVDVELQLRGVNAHSANIKNGIGKVEAIPTKNLNPDDVDLGAPGEWIGQPATYLPERPKNFNKLPAADRERLQLRIDEKTLEYKQFNGLADDPTGKTAKVKKMMKAGGAEVELGSNYKARIQLETTQKGRATLLQYKRLEVNGKPVFDHKKGPRPIVSDFDFHALIDRRTGRNLPAAIRGQVELELMNEFSKAAHEGLIPFGFHGWTHSGFDLASKDFRHVAKYLLMYASETQARKWARKWAPKFFPELGAIADPRKHERAYRKAIEAMLDGFTRGKHLVRITATEAVFGPGVDPTIGMPLP